MIARNHAVLNLNNKDRTICPVFDLRAHRDAQFLNGGDERIRTSAQVAPPKALAKPPLRPLGYISILCAL